MTAGRRASARGLQQEGSPMTEPLQFDKADYGDAPGPSACGICAQPLRIQYYEVNGAVACSACKASLERERNAGSAIGRLARATIFGLLAGAVGTGIWYAVRKITGYELGLIAIVVGLLVGGAVKYGSRGRGGWAYQALAMFLTYASIVSTYVPEVVQAFREMRDKENPSAVTEAANPQAPATAGAPATASSPLPVPLAAALAVLLVFAIAFAAPFLGGFSNVMGIIIIAIALYEAWKINRKAPFALSGPFRLATPAPPTASA
jgi:hypothetical protein